MGKRKIKIRTLLEKNGLYYEGLKVVDYHMNILSKDTATLLARLVKEGLIEIPNDITQKQLAELMLGLIQKCDANNPNYDSKIDEEMTRIGNYTDREQYVNIIHTSSRNNNGGLYEDDESGYGTDLTSLYEDLRDSRHKR